MGSPAGFGAGQFGVAIEATPGTPVTVDTFVPVLTGARIQNDIQRIESAAMRPGRRITHAWKPGSKNISGRIPLELNNRNLAPLLRQMFGGLATTGGDDAPYTHTATPDDLTGKALTMQLGVPDITGTVRALTYTGCKVGSWEIAATVGETAKLNLDVVAVDELLNTSLASWSAPADLAPFVYTEGAFSIGGTALATVKDFTVSGDNALTDRHRIGSNLSKEHLENGRRSYTGEATLDFTSLEAYQLFVNGTEVELQIAFTAGGDSLVITEHVRFNGETPELRDELAEQKLSFSALHASSDAGGITATLTNADPALT